MLSRIANVILWIIAGFYAYGALVHVLNMLGMTSFDWMDAPAKWQILDVVYLVLDIAVAAGLLVRSPVGYVALIITSTSQIILYTFLRDWIVDVPEPFTRSAEEMAYLDTLVVFHIVTLGFFCLAIWLVRKEASFKSG